MSNWKDKSVNAWKDQRSRFSQMEKAFATKAEHMPKHIYRHQSGSRQ